MHGGVFGDIRLTPLCAYPESSYQVHAARLSWAPTERLQSPFQAGQDLFRPLWASGFPP